MYQPGWCCFYGLRVPTAMYAGPSTIKHRLLEVESEFGSRSGLSEAEVTCRRCRMDLGRSPGPNLPRQKVAPASLRLA